MKRRYFLAESASLACSTLTNLPAFAAPRRKGVQLVLLPHWSTSSVNNFLAIFRDTRGSYTNGASEIEIAFAPYLFEPNSNYGNAQTIINTLRSGGKKIYITVHLSFHAKGNSSDAKISGNAKDFVNSFLIPYQNELTANNLIVAVCPSLEDEGSDADFSRWAEVVASQIKNSGLLSKVYLRRSGLNSYGLPGNLGFRGRQNEIHGAVPGGKWAAYSNDGNFVYDSRRETAASLLTGCNGSNPSPQYPLTDFINQVNQTDIGVVLLWRPAYNLLKRERNAQNMLTYTRCGRDLSDSQISFNSVEQNVLKTFLGM